MNLKKIFNETKDKATKFVEDIDKEEMSKKADNLRKGFQDQLKKYNVDEKIEKVKKESVLISEAISEGAKEVYLENEELLKKPVDQVSKVIDKIAKHSTEIKWTGGIVAGVVAPVPTLVVSSLLFLLSSDEEQEKAKEKRENDTIDDDVAESLEETLKNKENMPENVSTSNEWINFEINLSENTSTGTVLRGTFKDQTFETIGVKKMQELADILPDEEEAQEAKRLINSWISWYNSK